MRPARESTLRTAIGLRTEGRFVEALQLLEGLARDHPRFSRLYQERAQCLVHLGDGQAAIAALNEALRLNSALPACWDMLAQLLHRAGGQGGAAEARQRADRLAQLPREVVMANALYADGDHGRAAAILRDYLTRDEGNLGAAHLLARVLMESAPGEDEAERILRAVQGTAEMDQVYLDFALAKATEDARFRPRVAPLRARQRPAPEGQAPIAPAPRRSAPPPSPKRKALPCSPRAKVGGTTIPRRSSLSACRVQCPRLSSRPPRRSRKGW